MKYPPLLLRFIRLCGLAVAPAGAIAIVAACTTKTVAPPAADAGFPPCDSTQCAPKNECIAGATGEAKCRLPCAAQADCPFNYACVANDPRNYCVKTTVDIAQKPMGQWGFPCLPPGGQDGNPACDAETGFACYGKGTTDATSYCTRYDCMTDLDCAGGYWCATINVQPSVKSDKRSFGKTRTACLKREYCAPCAGDVDCPAIDGQPSRCIPDKLGGSFCTTPCTSNANCRLDAACGQLSDGTKLCNPRAGLCKGDGSICSPCRSDADCPDGFCIKGPYSPERFCSVKSTTACSPSGMATFVKGTCPAFTGFPGTNIGCQASDMDETIPKDQCVGLITFADTGDIACYSKH